MTYSLAFRLLEKLWFLYRKCLLISMTESQCNQCCMLSYGKNREKELDKFGAFVQALRSRTKKFGSVVAVVEANFGWSQEALERICASRDCRVNQSMFRRVILWRWCKWWRGVGEHERKSLLADMSTIAVGPGVTAVLGASSPSNVVCASTFIKLATYKIPATLKFGLAQLQKAATIGLGKLLVSTNLLTHGLADTGAKASTSKFTASAKKTFAITHSLTALTERSSLLAMRASFVDIMRKKSVQSTKFSPLSCGMVACTVLLAYGNEVECAAESLPWLHLWVVGFRACT